MKFQKKCLFPINWQKITFDDVSFVIPEISKIKSRRDIDLSVYIKNLKLNLPIMWANMSTVMDFNSARYLSLMGGIWIIHQNMSIENQIEQIIKVKRYGTPIVNDPYCLDMNSTISDVINSFEEKSIWAVIIVDDIKNKKVKWIITKRDVKAMNSINQNVCELMTKFDNMKYIKSENINIDIKKYEKELMISRVEQLPIINPKWKIIWLFTSKWLDFYNKFENSARDHDKKLVVWAAVWQNRDPLYRSSKLIEAWIDLLIIDTAHWWTQNFLKVIKEIRYSFPDMLIWAWNIDNPNAAIDLIKAWVDILKVWIWPGWACKTRVQTWFGTPQISAIWQIKEIISSTKKYNNIKIIWDWWINKSWNMAKAIAAWADFVMIWSLFAGTDIAPWKLRDINWKLYKDFRWMASEKEANIANKLSGRVYEDNYWPIFDEWANDIIPYKWDWSFIKNIRLLHWWLASSLSYANAKNLKEFYDKSRFQLQTMNWAYEWTPWAFN